MKHTITSLLFIFSNLISFGQSIVNIGDKAPKYVLNKVLNTSDSELDISNLNGKPTILYFWGTWCAPCIPEIIRLDELQNKFNNKIQVIGVSNDNEEKLKNYIQKRPSKVWFASDVSNNLWNIFDIQIAGHAVLIDKHNRIVSITKSKNIDSVIIEKLISTKNIELPEETGTKYLKDNSEIEKTDSTTIYSFVLKPELKGITPMMKKPNTGVFANRRITIINLNSNRILNEAFEISTDKKIFFPAKIDSLKSTEASYCIDFIVPDDKKNNLKKLFITEINKHLPVKAEIQKKNISCYVIQPIKGKPVQIKQSTSTDNDYSYNQLSFEGNGIPISTFMSYLEGMINYPIYDATGLTKNYDIYFEKDNIEPLLSTQKSLEKIGLELVKSKKEIEVLLITAK